MNLGDKGRDREVVATVSDRATLTAVSLGVVSMVMASGAAAQQAAEPAELPPLEVTTKQSKKKGVAKKAPAQKATPAPVTEQLPQPPTPAEAGNTQNQAFTPASGNSLEAGTGIGRLPGSIQETPQVVNVIPQQQMKQQNTTTVEQTLRNVPGVTVAIGEGGGGFNGDQFRIRGFEAKGDLYIDGLRDFGVYVRDSFAIEEVQVLKGPSSESFGAGTTGGVINLRQKTAHLGDSNSVDFNIGTDNFYRTVVDVNKQIDSTTAMRAVGMYNDQDIPDRDQVDSERWGFLGSVGHGLGTDTSWIVNYLHQSGDRMPDYGVPNVLADGRATGGAPVTELGVPRSSFYGRITDHDDTNIDIVTSRFLKNLNSQATFYNDTRLAFYNRDFSTTVPGCGNAQSNPASPCASQFLSGLNPNVSFGGGNPTFKQDSWGFQNISSAVARFNAVGLRHEAVAGVDVFYQEDHRPGWSQANKIANTPIRNPGIRFDEAYDIVRNPANDRTSEGIEVGLFASDRVWLTGDISILGGVRWTTFQYDFFLRGGTQTIPGNPVVPIDGTSEGDYWSPKVSVIWEPRKSETYYISWAKSASPVGQFVTNALNPITLTVPQNAVEENESWEAGTKWSVLGDRLGLTAAVFQISKNGVFVQDPANTSALISTGESQRVRGVEFGISGQVTRAWIVNAGYTYLDGVITNSTATNPANLRSVVGNDIGGVPDNAIAIWTTYNLSENIIQGPGIWTVGTGVIWQSEMFPVNNSANQYVIPELFTLDAMLSYERDGWRVAVNGYNLTDELNYDQTFNNRATPSPGRSGILSVGKKF